MKFDRLTFVFAGFRLKLHLYKSSSIWLSFSLAKLMAYTTDESLLGHVCLLTPDEDEDELMLLDNIRLRFVSRSGKRLPIMNSGLFGLSDDDDAETTNLSFSPRIRIIRFSQNQTTKSDFIFSIISLLGSVLLMGKTKPNLHNNEY